MTSTHASRPAVTARSISALVRRAIGAGNARTSSREVGVVWVLVHGAAARTNTSTVDAEVLARAVAAAALQAGYDVAVHGMIVTITEPADEVAETVEEPAAEVVAEVAPVVTTRPVGAGLVEVASAGQAIGRLRTVAAGLDASDDRFDAYTTTGTRIGEQLTRDAAYALLAQAHDDAPYSSTGRGPSRRVVREACARLSAELTANADAIGRALSEPLPGEEEPLQVAHLMSADLLAACGFGGDAHGLYVVPSSTLERITCPRCLLIGLDEEVRRLGYRNAAHYLQGRPEVRARVEVAAQNPDGPALPRVEDEPVEPGPEVDDPREQPEPLEWNSVAAPVEQVHLRTNADPGIAACGTAGPLAWTTEAVTCPACLEDAATRYEAHGRFLRANRPEAWQAAEQDEAAAYVIRERLARA